jgi:hypothetical protein
MAMMLRLVLIAMLLADACASAQRPGDVVADRPHFGDSPWLVPAGMVQIEGGIRYEGDYALYTSRLPTVLLRMGLGGSVELRVGGDFVHREREVNRQPKTAKDNGASDLAIGAKLMLADGGGMLPASAVVARFALPLGAAAFRPDNLIPDLRLATSYTFNETFDLSANIGGEWDGRTGMGTGVYQMMLGVTLDDDWKGYLEAFGRFPADGLESHYIDGTIRYLLASNFELNLTGGYPFTPYGLDHFFEFGMVLRLPP